MKRFLSALICLLAMVACRQECGYQLVWSDEFNVDGPVNPDNWNFARGFGYNKEDQWYQEDNAFCKDGCLVIEARRETFPNPDYNPESSWWGDQRSEVHYTSSRINTAEKHEFLYGRFEMRARIPTSAGAWPAFWTLGTGCEYGGIAWPQCGEIDIMEYYPHFEQGPAVHANVGWYKESFEWGEWNSQRITLEKLQKKDTQWKDRFHIWAMDWTRDCVKLMLDGETINETTWDMIQRQGITGDYNPFRHPHYILLNLAIGGTCGGPIDDNAFPMRFEIDYVRVYQKSK